MVIETCFLALSLALASALIAAPGSPAGGYTLSWWTVDGGGSVSSGGAYTVSGTAGQADAGCAGGGSYDLTGGFWYGPTSLQCNHLYLPFAIR